MSLGNNSLKMPSVSEVVVCTVSDRTMVHYKESQVLCTTIKFTQPAESLCARDRTWCHGIDSHPTGPPLHSQVLGHGVWGHGGNTHVIRFSF